jgi:hypothetical protein
MKQVEFFYWQLRDPQTGASGRSSCRLTEADALRRDPSAVCVPGSCQVRVLPRHPDDYVPRFALRWPGQWRHE